MYEVKLPSSINTSVCPINTEKYMRKATGQDTVIYKTKYKSTQSHCS